METSPVNDKPAGQTRTLVRGIRPGEWGWVTPSAAVLGLANFVPLLGVVFLGWEVFPILFLYWLENVIVGGFNVVRMATVSPRDIAAWVGKLFLIPFFVVHYGMFTMVHGVFVFALFGQNLDVRGFFPSLGDVWGVLNEYQLVVAALALVASHGFSYGWNFLGKGEYRRASLQALMHQPYRRVVVLHLVVLLGGFAVLALGQPVGALLLLIVLKMGIDVAAHLHEHRKLQDHEEDSAGSSSSKTVRRTH